MRLVGGGRGYRGGGARCFSGGRRCRGGGWGRGMWCAGGRWLGGRVEEVGGRGGRKEGGKKRIDGTLAKSPKKYAR